ncbi:MAG: TIGR04551 family protein [Deltaproteobacteria bacterium]|nr:TIGR04551 family protein [Deltaproteobacteria bacterium]MBP6829180.1 TIGR04551 family protein [Deltaproteobacteria bacterium]
MSPMLRRNITPLLACCAATWLASSTSAAQPRPAGDEHRAPDREPYRDAPGVTPIGDAVRATADTPDQRVRLSGFLRTRGDLGHNWDLGRGPTPSLPSIWPTPYVDDGASHTQTNADMRLRVDASIEVGWGVSIRARAHVLDNLRLGSLPTGDLGGGSVTQRGPDQPIDVRQVYGQALLPFGVLTVGRMGALVDWGTGFFLNAGNGLDDDYGDVGDRIALTTPLAGLLWTALYEISATGPASDAVRPEIRPAFDLDPRDDVRTVAFSVARYNSPATRNRLLRAGRNTVEFGLVGSYRWQSYDVSAGDVPSARTALVRDLTAFVGDAWVRTDLGRFTFEGEFVFVGFRIANASLDPAAMLNLAVTGRQYGGVLRADYRGGERFMARVEFGFASGDDRPGFGARTAAQSGRAGDLDGLQFDLTRTPRDVNIQNFRFHPNYRVDLIMWRRLIGTVTDAWYVRPMVRYRIGPMLTAELAVIGSAAMEPNSTPSGKAPLGVETDIGLIYEQEHGFVMRLDYGLLLPLSGFDNAPRRLSASAAHALHAVMAWRF